MSSWLDQLDFSALQDQLVRSVEEASDLISNVQRLEILNLDDLAAQQEKEESLREMEEQQEEEEEECEAGERGGWSGEQLKEQQVSEARDALLTPSTVSPFASVKEHKHFSQQQSLINEVSSAERKAKKSFKKAKLKERSKKHLDFFGITTSEGDYDDEEVKGNGCDLDAARASSQVAGGGFGISSLWDYETIREEDAEVKYDKQSSDIVAKETLSPSEDVIGSTGRNVNRVTESTESHPIRVAINFSFQSRPFFDNVEEEVDLENDPIFKKVEENKLAVSMGRSPAVMDPLAYFNYFRQLATSHSSSSSHSSQACSQKVALASSGHGVSGSLHDDQTDGGVTAISAKLVAECRVICCQLNDDCLPLSQQLQAVISARQCGSAGSVLFVIASVLYIIMRIIMTLFFFFLKLLFAFSIFLFDLVLFLISSCFFMQSGRYRLPCSVETFSNRRRVSHLAADIIDRGV
eukprot:scaffold958_cov229-Ochromonas_danica.AAC.3